MSVRLSKEPLRAWIEARLSQLESQANGRTPLQLLAAEMGVPERTLFRWRQEDGVVDSAAVEDALHRIGVDLGDIYAEPVEPMVTVPERFWTYVPDRPDEPDVCWPWWGAMAGRGKVTPMFHLGRRGGRMIPAARLVYIATYGDPGERYVWRRCANHRCVRPEHLMLRYPQQRIGRGQWGEMNPNAKLTDREVYEVRVLYERGATQQQLADRYGITRESISYLVRGQYRLAAGGPIKQVAA